MTKNTKPHTQIARKLRRNQTDAEKIFWYQIRNRRFQNLKFKRQVSIPPYIVDFYCEDHRLIIEIDGGQHNDNVHDKVRDKDLESKGYSLLRFWNNDILNNIYGVMESISNYLQSPHPSSLHSDSPLPWEREEEKSDEGEGKVLIGEIKGAHGVKGLVRVLVYAQDIDLFKKLKNPAITPKNKHKGDMWLASVEGVTDKDAADALKGIKLYIPREDMPELAENEVYLSDLIGMECIDEQGDYIGEVIGVENFGAGDLLDIRPPSGQNFYLSYDDNTVLKIDGKITVRIPELI